MEAQMVEQWLDKTGQMVVVEHKLIKTKWSRCINSYDFYLKEQQAICSTS